MRHARRTPGDPSARRRSHRRALWIAICFVLLVLLWVAWLAADAFKARNDLTKAADLVSTLQAQVVAGDRDAAAATLDDLQDHSSSAYDATHGPHWTLAGALPWAGPNIKAVQVVSEVVENLATEALPGLMDATDLVDPSSFTLVGGRIDLAPLQEAAPVVVSAHNSVRGASERLGGIDTDELLAAIAGPVTDLEGQIRDVSSTTSTAAKAVELLPPMLGADGIRNYLLLVQNTAEVRATGGIPGSVVHLSADDGTVRVVDQRSGGSLGNLPAPVLPLTPAENALFGDDLTADMRDVTFTPDFPRTGQIASAIWTQEVGGTIDGVLSVDPATLALVLGATGPVPLAPGPVSDAAGGMLTADNAVQVLLNTVYLELEDPAEQDAFFTETAASVFTGLVTGQGEPAAAVDALAEAARQDRLLVWSSHTQEQEMLTGTVLSGELSGARGDSPVIGVFLNDGTAAKMNYYMSSTIKVQSEQCRPDGSQAVTVEVTLTNAVPSDAASLPPYITGGGAVVPPGQVRTNVLVYAPRGGNVAEVRVKTGEPGVTAQIHDDLPVVGKTVLLDPGESFTINYDIVTGIQSGLPIIRSSPINDRVVTYPTARSRCG